MLSYQHSYHAGNLADVHKHALLAVMLDYLTRKDKPLSYLETHAGRGLYNINDEAALKTGEAAAGIARVLDENWFAADHPYLRAVSAISAKYGATAYPGSPLVAAELLRPGDTMHLAELHPQEHAALRGLVALKYAQIYHQDGFQMAQSICPPTPRRGMLLIDPSFEVKSDYLTIPEFVRQIHRKWNVGVIALWYPILADNRHVPMLVALKHAGFKDVLRHEVKFTALRAGHGMIGSGMFIVNPPYGLVDAAAAVGAVFYR